MWHHAESLNDSLHDGDVPAFDRFDALIEMAGEFIGVFDLHQRPEYINPAGLKMVGLDSLSEAQHFRFEEFFFAADRGMIAGEFFRRVVEEGRGEVEVRFRHLKSGEAIWVRCCAHVLRDSAGRPEKIATISSNITKQKAAAALAQTRSDQIQALVDALPGLFAYVDTNLRYLWVNRGHAEFFGLTVAANVGQRVEDLLDESTFQLVGPKLRSAIAGQPERFEVEFPDSETRLSTYVETMYVPDGFGLGCFAMAFDVTSRKELEKQLRETLAELSEVSGRKDRFLATLAHELRNPLAPLRTGLALLEQECKGEHQEVVGLMTRQLAQVVRLVDDLLDVARISRDKIELHPEMLEFQQVLWDAVAAMNPFVVKAGHALHIDIADEPRVEMYADRARLIQVFSNLLHNAVKYTPVGGEIRLSMRVRDDEVEVRVVDTGRGIEPQYFETIFQLFSQIETTEESRSDGLGLGLMMVRSFVEMHGGRVSVESGGRGAGATFIVTMPRSTVAISRAQRVVSKRVASIERERRLRVLVVDDNTDGADLLSNLIQSMGHDVSTAYDGAEALRSANASHPELIIMDIGMPVMNGYETASAMRGQPWRGNATIVALTGWGQEGDRVRAIEAGFDKHLVKPVEPEQIEDLLRGIARAVSGRAASGRASRGTE